MAATVALDLSTFMRRYKSSNARLFLLDYDGTLSPIVKDANKAVPTDVLIRTLKNLASDSKTTVWIISGRDQAFLDKHLGQITDLGLSAEHGCFMRKPNASNWENLAETFDMSFKAVVTGIFEGYTKQTPGSRVKSKRVGVTWHYREVEDQTWAVEQATKCECELNKQVTKHYDVDVMAGKANLEVRPRFINKGAMAKKLVEEYGEGGDKAPSFVFCAGDDTTDEGRL